MGETTTTGVGEAYLREARRQLRECHSRLKHCLDQLDDTQLWWRPREEMNSVANLVLHLCGNLRQWLVAAVGGAADARDRPREFAERGPLPGGEVLRRLDAAVVEADAVLAGADPTRLLESCRVQGFGETVLSAIFACLTHLSGHTQEVVYATRLQLGEAYRFAWTPASPEQGAPVRVGAAPADLAVTDAAFEQLPVAEPGTPPLPPADARAAPGGPGRQASGLGDYVRELGEEFQDVESQGKL